MNLNREGLHMYDVAKAILAGDNPSLDEAKAYWAATDFGERPKEETVAVLATLAAAPPAASAVRGFVLYANETYPPVPLEAAADAINIVGTGGGPSTFNISTASAFVAAGAGAKVLKSGSAAYSSSVGSQDMLTALGLAMSLGDEGVDTMLADVGIAFTPPTRYAPICRRLAVAVLPLPFKTLGRFVNRMGPLIGPHRVAATIAGASSSELFEAITAGARLLGRRMMVVTSEAGADELIAAGTNHCLMTDNNRSWAERRGTLTPSTLEALEGGDLEANKARLLAVLDGRDSEIALATVALNAGAVLLMAGLAADLREGEAKARKAIASGAALERLHAAQDHIAGLRAAMRRGPKAHRTPHLAEVVS